jgi:hypothetical protein
MRHSLRHSPRGSDTSPIGQRIEQFVLFWAHAPRKEAVMPS